MANKTASTAEVSSPIGNDVYKRQSSRVSLLPVSMMGMGMDDNQVPVTQHTVLGIPPFWRATNILCGFLGKIPVELKRKTANKRAVVQRDDDRHFLMNKKPHHHLRARTWKQSMGLHYGVAPSGGFSEIVRDPDTNKPMAILPLDPNRVAWGVELDAYDNPIRMIYLYVNTRNDGMFGQTVDPAPPRVIPVDDMLHFKGLSYDTVMGIDKINVLQRSFGLMLSRTEFQRKYYIGNARFRGFLMVPPGAQEQFGVMMEVIAEHVAAQSEDPLKAVPLFDGAKFERAQDSPEDAQLIEAMKTDPDTCGVITGVPGFLLGADTRDSYSSLEKVMQAFFMTTVDDLFDEFETEMDDKLLTEKELRSDELGFRFDREKLMATDVAEFHKMLKSDLHGGVQSWEEVRQKLDLTTNPDGMTFFVPQNVVGANPTSIGSGSADPPAAAGNDNRVAMRKLAEGVVSRVCERLTKAAARSSKNADKFIPWLNSLDPGGKERTIEQDHLRPVFDVAIASGLIESLPDVSICGTFAQRLKTTVESNPDDIPAQVVNDCAELSEQLLRTIPELITGVDQNANEN